MLWNSRGSRQRKRTTIGRSANREDGHSKMKHIGGLEEGRMGRKRFAKYIADAADSIRMAIAVGHDERIEGFLDLELIEAELKTLHERAEELTHLRIRCLPGRGSG